MQFHLLEAFCHIHSIKGETILDSNFALIVVIFSSCIAKSKLTEVIHCLHSKTQKEFCEI